MDIGNTVSILNLIRMAAEGIHKILSHKSGSQRGYFKDRKREEHYISKTIRGLNRDELIYLFQYKQNRTTMIAFNRTDPIVRLLTTKRLIKPSYSALDCFDAPARYKTSNFDNKCQLFELVDITNKYMIEHPEVFDKINLRSLS